ncbi:MAG: hypothetical protein ABI645_01190 [Pseudomonadota bacterium]
MNYSPTNSSGSRSATSSVLLLALSVLLALSTPVAFVARFFALCGVVICAGYWLIGAPHFPTATVLGVTLLLWLVVVVYEALRSVVDAPDRNLR